MSVDVGTIKDFSIIVGGAIAFITLWQGLFQYTRQNHAARANQFIQMRRRFLEEKSFQEILTLIHENCDDISTKSIQDRRNLVGYFEEVALMVNSGLIRPEVAHYMFGYYVVLIDDCEKFWEGLDRQGDYWAVFRAFVGKMRTMSVAEDIRSGNIRI
jgi:hypothetical protein